jgi:hypothetical protein
MIKEDEHVMILLSIKEDLVAVLVGLDQLVDQLRLGGNRLNC